MSIWFQKRIRFILALAVTIFVLPLFFFRRRSFFFPEDVPGGHSRDYHLHRVPWPRLERHSLDGPRVPNPVPGSLIRPLAGDPLHPLVDDIFLMFKTGADVMWRRSPIHLHTTFTRFPYFSMYSDRPGTIAGYEVIDILKDLPEDVLNSPDLTMHKVMRQMQEEAWMWGAHELSLTEGWKVDRFKNIPIMLHAFQNAPPTTKWFIMMDDDTYVMSSNIARFLDSLDSTHPYYMGSMAMVHDVYFAHGGSGVIFSRGALERVFGPDAKMSHEEVLEKYSQEALHYDPPFGDLMAARLLKFEAGVYLNTKKIGAKKAELDMFGRNKDMFQGEAIGTTWVNADLWCTPIGTFHKVRPEEIEILWEWEQTMAHQKSSIYFSDFYQDFILPFISEEIPNWVIPGGKVLDKRLNEMMSALTSESKEYCMLGCKEMPLCLSWSYKSGECRVQENGVVKGMIADPNERHSEEPTWVSGYLIDRIREIRSNQSCDFLEQVSPGQYNDSPSTSEGWYRRKFLSKG